MNTISKDRFKVVHCGYGLQLRHWEEYNLNYSNLITLSCQTLQLNRFIWDGSAVLRAQLTLWQTCSGKSKTSCIEILLAYKQHYALFDKKGRKQLNICYSLAYMCGSFG